MTAARRNVGHTCEVIPFPGCPSRAGHPGLDPAPRQRGIFLDEPAALELERRLEDYALLVSRAWDVSAIAATIGTMTAASAEDCAAAALSVSQQILANISVPLGEPI
jgi:hypothetical protein